MADQPPGGHDAEHGAGGRSLPQRRPAHIQPRPAHPTLKANLLMIGIVLLIVALAVASTLGLG